jgi:hypothetical protein
VKVEGVAHIYIYIYIYIYIIRRDKVALDSRSLLLGEICYSNAYNKFFVVVI